MIDKILKTEHMKDNRKILFIVWIILLLAWMTMTLIPFVFKGKTARLIADYYDRNAYFERGKWFIENAHPLSEYPQIPTILFGLNHLISTQFDTDIQFDVYIAFFSLGMMLVLFLVFKALLELLPPDRSNYALLVLLPPTLYFTYNRFDILPAYLCLITYSLSTKKQWTTVSIVLAIATFTKWYPALLFPGFFMYATALEGKFQWKMILFFAITSITILLSSFLQGGLETILAPYQFHTARSMEFVAFPVLVNNLLSSLLGTHVNSSYYFPFFFIIQVSTPLLVFFVKFDSLEALTRYCIVTVGVFVFFSRIWSPQWFLWLLPFLIISARNTEDAKMIIIYNLISYLCFPIIFDTYGSSSYPLQISALLLYTILFIFIIQSFKGLKFAKNLISPF